MARGQVIAVIGEAGTGKSRLVHEFSSRLNCPTGRCSRPPRPLTCVARPIWPSPTCCVPGARSPEQASPADATGRLHDALAALPAGPSIYVPALQSLLELAVEDADWPTLEPTVRRQRMRSTVKDLFLRCVQNRPLLLWFEDMQWTDVETQDVVESLVEAMGASRLLVVLTCRPEYEADWESKDCVTRVDLDPLESNAADQLVRSLLGDSAATAELRALIVERTGGTPLFIEETVRTLVESGVLRARDGGYELTRGNPRNPDPRNGAIGDRCAYRQPQPETQNAVANGFRDRIGDSDYSVARRRRSRRARTATTAGGAAGRAFRV